MGRKEKWRWRGMKGVNSDAIERRTFLQYVEPFPRKSQGAILPNGRPVRKEGGGSFGRLCETKKRKTRRGGDSSKTEGGGERMFDRTQA